MHETIIIRPTCRNFLNVVSKAPVWIKELPTLIHYIAKKEGASHFVTSFVYPCSKIRITDSNYIPEELINKIEKYEKEVEEGKNRIIEKHNDFLLLTLGEEESEKLEISFLRGELESYLHSILPKQ